MDKTLAAIALALACCLAAAARPAGEAKEKKQRTVYIYGGVYDSFTKARLKAVVTLMRADSTVVATDTCNVWNTTSSFGFYVPGQAAQFIIKAEAEGYDDAFARYDLRPQGRKRYYDVPRLLMKRSRGDIYKSVGLDEVVVSGTRVQLAYRGDTLVYDASAFNLPEGSMLDALIRQMPGAELKDDGTIYVNGRKVDYLLLNGKEFFKGKNKVMLENLPYFTVKEVKVYDKSTEKSEMLGRDVEPKDYVMDVSLKREYARSYIANAEAGAGTDSRWAARAFGLYFDDHTRVTLFGNANNVNENRRPGSDGDWSPAKMERGLLSTKQAGLNLMTEDKDKRITDRLEASAQWDDSDNERHNSSLTFASGGDIAGGSSSRSRAKDFTMNVYNYLYLRKLHIANSNDLTYGNSRSRSSERDSTLRDTLTNSSLSEATGRTRRLRYNGFTDWTQPLPWGDDINLTACRPALQLHRRRLRGIYVQAASLILHKPQQPLEHTHQGVVRPTVQLRGRQPLPPRTPRRLRRRPARTVAVNPRLAPAGPRPRQQCQHNHHEAHVWWRAEHHPLARRKLRIHQPAPVALHRTPRLRPRRARHHGHAQLLELYALREAALWQGRRQARVYLPYAHKPARLRIAHALREYIRRAGHED